MAKTNGILFTSEAHENFYNTYLAQCWYQDVYHKALVYCLGIDRDTRNHVKQIYDFRTGSVKPECLHDGWQTSGSVKIVRMAFNLYFREQRAKRTCSHVHLATAARVGYEVSGRNGTPSIYNYDESDPEGQLKECQYYTVEELFCCGYARYFWEAVKIRYPEYVGL